ncbi:MAG: hypothetical protein HDR80_08665 [Bacteroides sp.]|nr:hypothetical protein [Bacteroides sp.]
MTDFDKRLIEKASGLSRWDYPDIIILMKVADTREAKRQLSVIYSEYIDLVTETI